MKNAGGVVRPPLRVQRGTGLVKSRALKALNTGAANNVPATLRLG